MSWHIAPVAGVSTVFASIDYPAAKPPERIEIAGTNYIIERTAKRAKVPRKSHVSLGHHECGACSVIVGAHDHYCRMCGARLEDEWTKGEQLGVVCE